MNLKYILLILTLIAAIFSFVGAKEQFTWWLEAIPVFVGILALLIFRKFDFTNLVYVVIFIPFFILKFPLSEIVLFIYSMTFNTP